MNINWKFLDELEGQGVLHGYVPHNQHGEVIGNSGVTIGTGVDLGQMDNSDLSVLLRRYYPAPFELFAKLSPYLSLKRRDAVDMLKITPLTITREECTVLDTAMRDKVVNELRRKWLEYTSKDFKELPEQVQTVLFSLAWNFGGALDKAIPNTWVSFINSYFEGNWSGAWYALETFNSKNRELEKRRKIEADYMKPLTSVE